MVEMNIVSGFLGAGKTTLLRQLIMRSQARGEHSVVIENEFGAVGLDAAHLARTGVPVYELNHGCVCCTLKSGFANTLERILVEPLPDRLFFEPSGIFTPESLLDILRAPFFARCCRVASFITVVDARNFISCRRKFSSFFRRQAAFADTLAVAKSEHLQPAALAELRLELQLVNPEARQILIEREDIAVATLDTLLSGRSSPATAMGALSAIDNAPAEAASLASLPHGFAAIAGQLPRHMPVRELHELLKALSAGRYGNVMRSKGRLWGDNGWLDFSLVAGSVEIRARTPDGSNQRPPAIDGYGEIVIIGETLDEPGIRQFLRAPQAYA